MKEPIAAEYPRLREGLVLFTYLHIAADEPLTRALVESGITAVAYETVETDDRRLPLLAPMSEIAGRLAAQAGAYFLEKPLGGRGLLLGGVPGVAPGRVLVLGGGVVGYNAAIIAIGLGAQVTILDRSIDRMRYLDEILSGRVSTVMSSTLQIESSIAEADLVIGAVLVPGARAPKLVTRDMLGVMKKGAVIVDVAIDQGGCVETAHPTTHSDPVYDVDGITHYCVANMPGGVPITSTKALTNATLPVRRGDRRPRARRGRRARPGARPRRQRGRRQDHVRARRRGARPGLHAASDSEASPAARLGAVALRRARSRLRRQGHRTTNGLQPTCQPGDRPDRPELGCRLSEPRRLRAAPPLRRVCRLRLLRRREPHDEPRHACRERDHDGDVDDESQ